MNLMAMNPSTPFDFVIHFAGLKSAEESVNEPLNIGIQI